MYLLMRYLFISLFLFLPVISFAESNLPSNNLIVKFDLENHKINGISEIRLPEGKTANVNLSGLKILSAAINNKFIKINSGASAITFVPETSIDTLKIEYESEFNPLPDNNQNKDNGIVEGNIISSGGIVLLDGWYPYIDGFSVYSLKAVLPHGFNGVSEAEKIIIEEKTHNDREFSFFFPHPLSNISLIAGNYWIEKDNYNGIDIFAYFLSEDKGLARTYLSYTKKYFDMYEKLIGRYPFKRFSIVENILPTGNAMPTFTLFGQEVIRLPFIVETSLGHEILHQWLGNLVYIDYKNGNWAEGLTTYLADHLYEDIKGNGWDYRKNILMSFSSYVRPENDFPLKSFTGRTDKVTQGIGYGKSAMVFHMLKKLVGNEIFYDSLKIFIEKNRFRNASWDDIRKTFESASGKNLDWFFKEWVEEKGIPEIEVRNVNLRYRGSRTIVSLEIVQKGKNYKISIPVLFRLKEGEIRKTLELDKEINSFEIEMDGKPLKVIIDEDYDIFRKLTEKEYPATISRLLGSKNKIFVIPQAKSDEFASLSDFLKEEGFIEKKEGEIKYDDFKTASLIIPDSKTGLGRRLFGNTEKLSGDFCLVVRENPFNNDSVIAVIDYDEPSELFKHLIKMDHYGKYSSISFKNGKNILKEVNKSERGIEIEITKNIIGVDVPHALNLSDVIEKVNDKSIVYVGEFHTRFENHRVQLEVIRELHRKNRNIAIGMEMFEKPYQKMLNDYVAGISDEKDFLKKSEYFNRWGFDYNLYREILLYAREYKIPVIALNIRREIVSKVSRGGLSSLTKDELKEIPGDIDLTDNEYRKILKETFEKHKNSENKNFDFFYEAQVLWDESMAHNLNEFINKNPGYQVIVLTGSGHLVFGSGIPKRAYRLNKKEYSVILNNEDVEKNIGDFVMFPEPVAVPESPMFMVRLTDEGGKVRITDFPPHSISKRAGLKKGDTILSLDNTKVESIGDIKIFLLYKKKGDEVIVEIERSSFLFGTRNMIFKIKLQ